MKIKDIIIEQETVTGPSGVNSFKIIKNNPGAFAKGFIGGLVSGLKPKAFQDIEKPKGGPDLLDPLAIAARGAQNLGDNPEEPEYKGIMGWLPPERLRDAETQKKKNKEKKDKKIKSSDAAKKFAELERGLPDMVSGKTPASAPAPSVTRTTAPPPQVRLPSGEFITKYGGSWYNELGQQVTNPSDIASLERRVQKPAGQTQMATTKNIPVNLPGYKGKR